MITDFKAIVAENEDRRDPDIYALIALCREARRLLADGYVSITWAQEVDAFLEATRELP